MGLIRGCHLIAGGSHSRAMTIVPLIQKHGLLVDASMFGTAAWAYYADMVPIDGNPLRLWCSMLMNGMLIRN